MSDREKKNKKGFSMVETMIAMAVIVVVCASSIIIVRSFIEASDRMLLQNKVISMVENTKELFLYSESAEQFDELLPAVSDVEFTQNDANPDMYIFDTASFDGYITISYSTDSTEDCEYSAFVKNKSGKTLIDISHFKKYN